MELKPGAKLGPYEIAAAIGAGGMGEVFRARDTRLDRTVAIKVLPRHIAASETARVRFEREARTVSSLNHPNICVLFDIGREDGIDYMVLEYLEGETLGARIAKGPMPLDQVFKYATQIADALDRAHRTGVSHRDVKPANVMITRDGCKVLDFGLAKTAPKASAPSDITVSVALTAALTHEGAILGTPQYMAPEQYEGQEADARSDIFAFGCVVYEMVTGKRCFQGKSSASLIAAVLGADPAPMSVVQPVTPRGLERLVRRCLAKDPEDRYQSMRDVVLDLRALSESGADSPTSPPRRPWRAWTAAGVLALVAAVALWAWAKRAPPVAVPTHLSVLVPANRPVSIPGYPTRSLALSPDGTQLVYVGTNLEAPADQPGGRDQLQLRSLTTLEVRDLPGTTGACQPFFSPDGQWVAFFTATGGLKKISLAGGNPVTLAARINVYQWSFGVWTEDNTIIFSSNPADPSTSHGLCRVSAEGGKVTDLTTPDAAQGEIGHGSPTLVRSRRAVLFSVGLKSGGGRIDAVMLDSGKRQVVVDDALSPLVLGSGHLLFERGAEFLIAPFDASRLTVTGPAVPLIEKVRRDSSSSPDPRAEMAVSRDGTLAYLPAADTKRALGLVGRDGTVKALGVPPNNFSRPRVSRDGRSIAYIVDRTVYVYDMQRGSTTKVTQDGHDDGIAWYPDGRALAIDSIRQGTDSGIFLRNLGGGERLLVPRPASRPNLVNFSWSSDGTRLAYTVQTGSQHDIWVLTMGEKPAMEPFIHGATAVHSPKFSPDGQWLAYVSNESGRPEVYVRAYPQGERLAVSTDGGIGPVWGRDGKELFFEGISEGARKMMAVAVTPEGASLLLAKPVPLFDLRVAGPTGAIEEYAVSNNFGAGYDVLLDGRFVMARGADRSGTREIVVVQNWFEELKRLAPAK